MIAKIKIIYQGKAFESQWNDWDGIAMEEFIKEECNGVVDFGKTAMVHVEVLELEPIDREYGSNIPDEFRFNQKVTAIDDLIYSYFDTSDTPLQLVTSRQVHNSLN